MKTLIITTALLVILSTIGYGQKPIKMIEGTTLNETKLSNTEQTVTPDTKSNNVMQDKGWRIGVQFGNSGNNSKLTGGMQTANSRFSKNIFGAPSMNIVARYDFNRHWMLQSGIGLNALGFGYSISENYSLLSVKKQFSDLRTIFPTIEVPVSISYKSNLNCKNSRWVIGAGLVPTLRAKQTIDKDYSLTTEGTSTNYLSSHSASNGGASVLVRWSISREKVFRKGSILQASLLVNMGFSNMASSTVNYTLDNQNYTHSFSNNGSSVGFRLAYFLKPFGKH